MLSQSAALLTLIFWPVNLFLANTQSDFLVYFIPAALLFISYFFYKLKSKFYLFPILFIPLISPKLLLFAILFIFINTISNTKTKFNLVVLVFLTLITIFSFKEFKGQTIFRKDHEKQQQVIQNTQLYDSIFLARLMHNKARIPLDKLNDNFFALTDPNNYFFGYHPRQITQDNQNLQKFPFLLVFAIPLIFINFSKVNHKKFVLISLFSALINLSILQIFDRNDFILWLPISLVLVNQIASIKKHRLANYIFTIFILVSLWEIYRILIIYK